MERKEMWIPFWKRVAIVMVVLITILSVVYVVDMIGPAYEFRKNVHGHMENAYYANSPELMMNELDKAVEGMCALNLENDMYGAFWPWEKTPDRRMDYQYKHLDSVYNRIAAVIDWRDKTYGNVSEPTEQLGDVYEQKMDNLRGFLKEEGWSDWIAQDAYYVNNYLWIYLFWIWYGILLVVATVYITWFAIRGMMSDWKKVFDEKTKRWRWETQKDEW